MIVDPVKDEEMFDMQLLSIDKKSSFVRKTVQIMKETMKNSQANSYIDFEKLVENFSDLPMYQGRQDAIAKKHMYEFNFEKLNH